MCVVSADSECNPAYPTHCIYENVEYRFRVEKPVVGYLHIADTVSGKEVKVVKDFNSATPLNLWRDPGWGLRVSQIQPDGKLFVFESREKGEPIRVAPLTSGDYSQWYAIESPLHA